MNKLKKTIILVVSFYFLAVSLIIYSFLSPNFTKKECEVIRKNFGKLKIGMSKEEVLLLIGKESDYKIYRYPRIFPEQKTVWEFWLLCKEKPYKWQMIAFDSETEKVVKVFYDELERIGFD